MTIAPLADWDAVAAYALSLPGTESSTSYGAPAVKVNRRLIVSRSREPSSFHVVSTHEEKSVLIATDPDAFWQTPHYRNWPGLLVRFDAADAARVGRVIARAWWDRLTAAQRKVHGARP